MEKNQELGRRHFIDSCINIGSQAVLFGSIVAAPVYNYLTKGSLGILREGYSSEEIWPFTLNFTVGVGLATLSSLTKIYNDSTQLIKLKDRDSPMLDQGLHSLIRHPTYLMQRFCSLATAIAFPNPVGIGGFLSHLGLSEYLARREEKTCELQYGEDYKNYKEKTSRWIPSINKITRKIRKVA